ncbi:FAD-dependent oxidoreductase [Nocardia speluncae]|uniref:FAD-dependent oxidoreductase n=1 Tax=Nocardia speluncae TaxID=419477 RepID=A0A846X753_9NOCA|nr:FAD-dependent oxidoreductase [Nocardia speluncae]NKY31738.1 FAD-dependent oxidoreductase [Nocardia speluncae]
MSTPEIDVIVVGAGPVGLTTAIVLTQLGHRVRIVDDQAAGANTSRAAVVHSRTLELLDPYGVVPALAGRGVPIPRFTIRDRDQVLVSVPFAGLPTAYPYTLMISQADTEKFLLERAAELGVVVDRPVTVAAIVQDDDSVTATLSDGERISARYLIGADGMHSTVREEAGIGFTGGSYVESFGLADIRLTGGIPCDEVILYFSPAGLAVVAPLPDDMYRVVAVADDAPRDPDTGFVQRLLDDRGPQAVPAVVTEVVWGSRFRVHHRLADTYRRGRILLAGDAAHVHSPAGGQGMNLGIEDAVTTGRMLSRVLLGESTTLLDEHAAARRTTARSVMSTAGRLTDAATIPAAARPLRNIGLRIAGASPIVRRRLAHRLSGLDRR